MNPVEVLTEVMFHLNTFIITISVLVICNNSLCIISDSTGRSNLEHQLQEGSQFVHELEDVSKVDKWQVHDGSKDHEEN